MAGDHGMPSHDAAGSSGDHGMHGVGTKTGLASSEHGYTFDSSVSTLAIGPSQSYQFRIVGPTAKVQTAFVVDQTKLLHFYGVRTDLTGYQHVHPAMATDGTWTAQLPLNASGSYRVFASFIAKDDAGKTHDLVLSRELTVPGPYEPMPLPAAANSAEVDGYSVRLAGTIGSTSTPFKLRFERGGSAVSELEPYLDTYAHLTAFRSGDLAFAHLHPTGKAASGRGGPDLSFRADLPGAGDYRLFIQFQTSGQLHTAALTTHAG